MQPFAARPRAGLGRVSRVGAVVGVIAILRQLLTLCELLFPSDCPIRRSAVTSPRRYDLSAVSVVQISLPGFSMNGAR